VIALFSIPLSNLTIPLRFGAHFSVTSRVELLGSALCVRAACSLRSERFGHQRTSYKLLLRSFVYWLQCFAIRDPHLPLIDSVERASYRCNIGTCHCAFTSSRNGRRRGQRRYGSQLTPISVERPSDRVGVHES
jgi:hypothetical protein